MQTPQDAVEFDARCRAVVLDRGDAGVAPGVAVQRRDERVDWTGSLAEGVDGVGDSGRVGDVRGRGDGGPRSLSVDVGGERVEKIRRPREQADGGAVGGEPASDGFAEAGADTDDEHGS